MIFVGIDPGKSGAICVLDHNSTILALDDTPVLTIKKGKKKRREYEVDAMVRLLGYVVRHQIRFIVLEAVHAMPGQGVTSMFSMGEGLGLWKGILTALGLPFNLVAPQRWKKAMLDHLPKEKFSSVLQARRLWPGHAEKFLKSKDGRAEAALMAEYLRREARLQHQVPEEAGAVAQPAGVPALRLVPAGEGLDVLMTNKARSTKT